MEKRRRKQSHVGSFRTPQKKQELTPAQREEMTAREISLLPLLHLHLPRRSKKEFGDGDGKEELSVDLAQPRVKRTEGRWKIFD